MSQSVDRSQLMQRAARLMGAWARASEAWWYALPDAPEIGCYGTGYDKWGVQTNQKYLAAMAMTAEHAEAAGVEADWVRQRAIAALRFSLATHLTGDRACNDGKQWGQTWISVLGVERMMHGVQALEPYLTDEDRAALERMLTSEAQWICHHHQRGAHKGVFGDPWNRSGKNVPESNLWNGALLWRVAQMYPDTPEAELYRERAHEFLINSVSVPADETDGRIVAGKPIRERFRGANFFPNYALDHHGYFNVGYMAICTSNAAMLHFDLRAAGLERPESLDHHEADLWQVLRRMVFGDARLARLGGDSRVRYAYCQEYLLPSLLYAADHLGDAHALPMVGTQLSLIEREAAANDDGSFYGHRLAWMPEKSPYYYTRLESDRANALGMLLAYLPMVGQTPAPSEPFEETVAGGWCEPEHGAAMHRSPKRLASFSWRAHGLTQGLCLPPDRGDLAEWDTNLAGRVRFVGEEPTITRGQTINRRVDHHHIEQFDGGFVTIGQVTEGLKLSMPEHGAIDDAAAHQIAFAALPDGHTVVGLQHCQAKDKLVYTDRIVGMRLGVPNDVYNDARQYVSAAGEHELSQPTRDELLSMGGWANVDGAIGAWGVYGAGQLVLDRSAARRGGNYPTLFVDELCWAHHAGLQQFAPGQVMLDAGWCAAASVSSQQTRALAESSAAIEAGGVRGVALTGVDGVRYVVLANFGPADAAVEVGGRRYEVSAGAAVVRVAEPVGAER